jgi:uncharacterized protein (DUF433 family)
MNKFERIEIDPRRCGGTPVIRGTRIPVAVLLDQLAAGESRRHVFPKGKHAVERR